MIGKPRTIVSCGEYTCTHWKSGRCIALRISLEVEKRLDDTNELVCDTYEHRDDWYDGDDSDDDDLFAEENWADSFGETCR